LQMQKQNVAQFATESGAKADDITEITNDADVFEFLIETCNFADGFKSTAFGIKKRFFSSKIDPPAGEFVAAPPIIPPADVIAGAVKRSRERDQRFLRSKGITEAAKIALDLVGEESDGVSPDNVKPIVECHAAVSGYEFAVVVGNRQKADMYDVEIQRAGSTKWEIAKSGTGKSVNVTITPTADGKAEQILVRVQLRKGNDKYGVPSDPTYVTVNP
jgi:hypothetical protein